MKTNKLTIILIIIIVLLLGYIIYDKMPKNSDNSNNDIEEVKITDTIHLDYVNIYLTNEGISYIAPINKEEIDKLKVNDSLKERLQTLYDRSFFYDIYINNYKLRAFRVLLDEEIKSIQKINVKDIDYIVFLKENNTIGLLNLEEYVDLLYTSAIDNYRNLKNILEIKDNTIIYLDGTKDKLIGE